MEAFVSDFASRLQTTIRDVPDFPKPGIVFKDITPVLQDSQLFSDTIDFLAERLRPLNPSQIVAIESRGFIFGAPLAVKLGAGLVLVRKPNKLPFQKESLEYSLEYGTDTLEIHVDSFRKGESVVIVDDLLATGGTAAATAQLVEKLGATVAALAFVTELGFLGGRAKLPGHEVISLLEY